jgi:hypothetical protein
VAYRLDAGHSETGAPGVLTEVVRHPFRSLPGGRPCCEKPPPLPYPPAPPSPTVYGDTFHAGDVTFAGPATFEGSSATFHDEAVNVTGTSVLVLDAGATANFSAGSTVTLSGPAVGVSADTTLTVATGTALTLTAGGTGKLNLSLPVAVPADVTLTVATGKTLTLSAAGTGVIALGPGVAFTGTATLASLLSVVPAAAGGPGLILFAPDAAGDPTTEFLLPNTSAAAPAAPPDKKGLLGVWDVAGTPTLWFSVGVAAVADWKQVYPAPGGGVTSVFGRAGAVVAAPGDYTAAQVTGAADVTAANVFTTVQSIRRATTNVNLDGLALETTAAATLGGGNQKRSPVVRLRGSGYATTPAAAQTVDIDIVCAPAQGTGSATANLLFQFSVAGGAFTTMFNISSAGAITTGAWNATPVGAQYGGTGLDTSLSAAGGLLYLSAAGAWSVRAVGTDGQRLEAVAGLPGWVGCRPASVTHSANQAIATATWTALAFDTERHDQDAAHDTVTNNPRLTAPVKGKYLAWALVTFAASATGSRGVRIRVGGATTVAQVLLPACGGGLDTSVHVAKEIALNNGDYVEVLAFQDSGGNLNALAAADYSPEFGLAYLAQ